MLARKPIIRTALSYIIIFSILSTFGVPPLRAQSGDIYLPLVSNTSITNTSNGQDTPRTIDLLRTRIRVNTQIQWQELDKLQIQILDQGSNWALVLVDDLQLTDLARLRYNPTDTNSLYTLVNANGTVGQWDSETMSALRSLVAQADDTAQRLAALSAAGATQSLALRGELRRSMRMLIQTTQQAVTVAATVDGDNDGLTDDQESYWCTNPAKADSDLDGVKDGAEVDALKAWLGNETAAPPSSGKPFQGWPNPNNNCFDDDRDSIPDVAEGLELGLNPNRESTDLDKFDDGDRKSVV